MSINLGATWRSISGAPISYLGAHELYGADEVFVLPRGAGGRTPWVHSLDGQGWPSPTASPRTTRCQLSVDVFNILNFAAVTSVDETYTNADVSPVLLAPGQNPQQAICIAGSDKNCVSQLHAPGGSPGDGSITETDLNKNYKNPTSYQSPRAVRFGLRVTF